MRISWHLGLNAYYYSGKKLHSDLTYDSEVLVHLPCLHACVQRALVAKGAR